MAKGASKPPQLQKPPDPSSAYTSINGQPLSSAVYNKGTNSYNINANMPDGDKQTYEASMSGLNELFNPIKNAMATSPEQQQAFARELYDPRARQINKYYDEAGGQGANRFNSMGMDNSVGFAKYFANEIEGNRSRDLSDAFSNAQVQSYDLPMLKMQPLMAGSDFYNQGIQSPFNRLMATMDPSFQGQQVGTNQTMAQWQGNNNRILQQNQLNQQYGSRPSFMRSLSVFYDPLNTMRTR